MGGFSIDEELAAWVVSGHSVVVATRSAALVPHATRACGIRVVGPSTIAVLLPRATSAQSVANLEDNGHIAVSVSSPRDFRSVQLKGRSVAIAHGSEDDVVLGEEQLRAFSDAVAPNGVSRQKARNLWLFDCWRVEVQVLTAYQQTPGPGTGALLEVTRGE